LLQGMNINQSCIARFLVFWLKITFLPVLAPQVGFHYHFHLHFVPKKIIVVRIGYFKPGFAGKNIFYQKHKSKGFLDYRRQRVYNLKNTQP
jgi:hypothetical protein